MVLVFAVLMRHNETVWICHGTCIGVMRGSFNFAVVMLSLPAGRDVSGRPGNVAKRGGVDKQPSVGISSPRGALSLSLSLSLSPSLCGPASLNAGPIWAK